jgi:L-iditol 2-dehydrogenase
MKLARYIGGGEIAIVDEPSPACPPGGLLVRTEASGLCSGELMDWYMEKKVPHVLGHECAGIIVESQTEEFPVGSRVFAHHHAPCLKCDYCLRLAYVHCSQWKRTKLVPGGMAEFYGVPEENLTDAFLVDDLRPIDAALIEPLACVLKAFSPMTLAMYSDCDVAVIGLGAMGLMHALLLKRSKTLTVIGYDINPARLEFAEAQGIDARHSDLAKSARLVFVCPGTKPALDLAIRIVEPRGSIMMFAPMAPGQETPVDLNQLYFKEVSILNSYSCDQKWTKIASEAIRHGSIRAEQVVSHFIGIDELPDAYQKMKRGEILKPMVLF